MITHTKEPKGSSSRISLEERAYVQLRRALVEGIFGPGQKLSIRQIAAELGTSPMPARTAIRRLITEQALDVLPSGTAIVPRLTRAAFRELGRVRAALEPLAVKLAADNLDASVTSALKEALATELSARQASDPEGILRQDRQFLFIIYRAAASPMLYAMIETAWLRRGPHFWEARWLIAGRPPGAAHHSDILAALNQKNGDKAADLLATEIEGTTNYLLERMNFIDDAAPEIRLRPIQSIQPGKPAKKSQRGKR